MEDPSWRDEIWKAAQDGARTVTDDREVIEEVAQETVARYLLRQTATSNRIRKPAGWAFRTAQGLAKTHYNHINKFDELVENSAVAKSMLTDWTECSDENDAGEEQPNAPATIRAIRTIFTHIEEVLIEDATQQEAEIYRYFVIKRLKYREIAQQTGEGEAALKKRWQRFSLVLPGLVRRRCIGDAVIEEVLGVILEKDETFGGWLLNLLSRIRRVRGLDEELMQVIQEYELDAVIPIL